MESNDGNPATAIEMTSLSAERKCVATNDKLHLIPKEKKLASCGRKAAVMTVCFLLQAITLGVGFGLSVMYVELMRVFSVNRTDAAWVQSLYLAMMTATSIVWGPAIQYWGPGPCIIAGSGLSTLGLFVSAYSTNILMVIVFSGVVCGTGVCTFYLGSYIAVGWIFHDNPSAPLILLSTGTSVGMFIIPYLYQVFITMYAWSGAFILISGIALQGLPCGVLIWCSKEFYWKGHEDDVDTPTRKLCDLSSLRDPAVILLLVNCLLVASTGVPENMFLVDMSVGRGFTSHTGALMISAVGVGNFIGRMGGGIMRLLLSGVFTLYHWMYVPLGAAVFHVLIVQMYHFWPLLLSCVGYGMFYGMMVAQIPAVLVEAIGLQKYASILSCVYIMLGLGNLAGGVLGGFTKDSLGEYDPIFYFAAAGSALIAVSSFVALLLPKQPPKDSSEYERIN